MKIKTHLKVREEPVYIVISKPILKECYKDNIDGFTYPKRKLKIIYLPTKKHIQKFLIKHEYYHLVNHHQHIISYPIKYYSVNTGEVDGTVETYKHEIDAMLYANEIYKKGNMYYMRKYFIDKRVQLRNYVKEEYLKLKNKEMANKEIDI